MSKLDGKTVLVVGASRGLGRGIAEQFAAAGANVTALARSGSALEQLAAATPTIGIEVADATDSSVVDLMLERHKPDVVVRLIGAPFLIKAEKLNKTDPQAPLALGRAYYAVRKFAPAAQEFARATALDHKLGAAWFALGIARLNGVETEAARSQWRRRILHSPERSMPSRWRSRQDSARPQPCTGVCLRPRLNLPASIRVRLYAPPSPRPSWSGR